MGQVVDTASVKIQAKETGEGAGFVPKAALAASGALLLLAITKDQEEA
nr:hypothetical protein [uncultured bacterium]